MTDAAHHWSADISGGMVRIWDDGEWGMAPGFVALAERTHKSLILAAPEMLETLREIAKIAADGHIANYADVIDRVAAVIALAEAQP